MTAITLGTGTTAPSDANELSKLCIWAIQKAKAMNPDLQFLLPYDEYDENSGQNLSVNRATAWIQRKVIWSFEGAGLIQDYGCRYRAFVSIPLKQDYNQITGKFWEKTDLDISIDSSNGSATNTFAPGTGGFIPATVDTYPKLLLWLAESLRTVTAGKNIFEDNPYLSVPVGSIQIIENTPQGDIAYCRFSIPVPSEHNSVADALYAQALMASSVPLPDSLKS